MRFCEPSPFPFFLMGGRKSNEWYFGSSTCSHEALYFGGGWAFGTP